MSNYWEKKSPEDPSDLGIIGFLGKSEYLDIIPSSSSIPIWIKKAPSRININIEDYNNLEVFSIKKCIPFLDAITSGYTIVLRKDINLSMKEVVDTHPIEQIAGMNISNEFSKNVFKWINEITIKTPEGYSCLFTHPLNNPSLPFYTMSGVVETDAYFQSVNLPFLAKNEFEVVRAGTPIAQIIPFKRDNWKSVLADRFDEEFLVQKNLVSRIYNDNRLDNNGRLFGGLYKKIYRVKKKYL
jgi:hypothetical protein